MRQPERGELEPNAPLSVVQAVLIPTGVSSLGGCT